jgi:copper homeostasis protein
VALKMLLNFIPSNINVTFHRAFDVCKEWKQSFEAINSMNRFNSILTSGQQPTAFIGRHLIREMIEFKRLNHIDIKIIAGCGITKDNLLTILNESKCDEFHASCRSTRGSKMIYRNEFISMGSSSNIDEFIINFTDKNKVNTLADIYKSFLNN